MKRIDEYELEWEHEMQRRRERDEEREPIFLTPARRSRPRYSRFRTLARLYERMASVHPDQPGNALDADAA